jgi:hypothetical protein
MSDTIMNCATCDELFLDWLEGDLDAAKRMEVDAHVGSCARCQGLLRDIQGIREVAAAMPDLAPSRDLWSGIEERIQPPVIAIRTARNSAAIPRYMLGAAAAALVAVSSGITYVATTRTMPTATELAVSAPEVRVAGATVEAPVADPVVEAAPQVENQRVSPPRRQPATALASRQAAPQLSAAELALSSEISELQDLLQSRRSELEPETVRVVEENLAIIDAAVSQARAAVARDPASGFLNERLESALQKKVQLLRTVALIRSST